VLARREVGTRRPCHAQERAGHNVEALRSAAELRI
jgi:hypothetical protein